VCLEFFLIFFPSRDCWPSCVALEWGEIKTFVLTSELFPFSFFGFIVADTLFSVFFYFGAIFDLEFSRAGPRPTLFPPRALCVLFSRSGMPWRPSFFVILLPFPPAHLMAIFPFVFRPCRPLGRFFFHLKNFSFSPPPPFTNNGLVFPPRGFFFFLCDTFFSSEPFPLQRGTTMSFPLWAWGRFLFFLFFFSFVCFFFRVNF